MGLFCMSLDPIFANLGSATLSCPRRPLLSRFRGGAVRLLPCRRLWKSEGVEDIKMVALTVLQHCIVAGWHCEGFDKLISVTFSGVGRSASSILDSTKGIGFNSALCCSNDSSRMVRVRSSRPAAEGGCWKICFSGGVGGNGDEYAGSYLLAHLRDWRN